MMETEVQKPWGSYLNILDESYTKVKKICVKPDQSPSYQYHFKRSEIWVIVQGVAQIKLDDDIFFAQVGDVIQVPKKAKHAVKNIGNKDLIFIEVQLGESFDEDDIVRIEDSYGRV